MLADAVNQFIQSFETREGSEEISLEALLEKEEIHESNSRKLFSIKYLFGPIRVKHYITDVLAITQCR